jgi:hydroxymethylglutaryl-CoA lyase
MILKDTKKELIKIVECPRDAMQGWAHNIPTEKKIIYLNSLLQVGFDSLDFGSFVSHKAIPQMADTKQVLAGIDPANSKTRLLAIVANTRGAAEAASYSLIQDIGFPFSISETFQKRNTNSSINTSLMTVLDMLEICRQKEKRLVVYISMAFGNPYGDAWSPEIAIQWTQKLVKAGVKVISLADTVGLASSSQVNELTKSVITEFPTIESGLHLHSRRGNSIEKLEAAYNAGCRRFDGAINGIGGCPMAGDELVGNMDSLIMIDYFQRKNVLPVLNEPALLKSKMMANEIFLNY